MGLVFSVAEAINLTLGVAAGAGFESLEQRFRDKAFRSRAAKRAKAQIPELARCKRRDLKRLLKHEGFFRSAFQGNAEEWRRFEEDDTELETLVERVFGGLDEADVERVVTELVSVITLLALQGADPATRLIHGGVEDVRNAVAEMAESLGQIGEQTSRDMLSSAHEVLIGIRTVLISMFAVLTLAFILAVAVLVLS